MNEKQNDQRNLQDLTDVKTRVDEIRSLEERIAELKTTILKESSASLDDTPDDLNFLLLQSDDRLLAAPLMYIDEVLDMPQLEAVPDAPTSVAGLINYHGDFLAVIDVRTLVGQKPTPPHPDQVVVICTVSPRRFALKVDEAHEVITVHEKDISAAKQVLPGVLRNSGLLRVSERRSALILDIAWIAIDAGFADKKAPDSRKADTAGKP